MPKDAWDQLFGDMNEPPMVKLESDYYKTTADTLRLALQLILDQVDYTTGNCRVNEMVGAVLPKEILDIVKNALKE